MLLPPPSSLLLSLSLFARSPGVRNKIEHILVAYFSSHPDLEFTGSFVHLVSPFVCAIPKEYEIYFCFASLMKYLGACRVSFCPPPHNLSHVLAL